VRGGIHRETPGESSPADDEGGEGKERGGRGRVFALRDYQESKRSGGRKVSRAQLIKEKG